MTNKIITIVLICFNQFCFSQTSNIVDSSSLEFYVHKEVTNADGAVEQELIQLWKDYLTVGEFQDINSPYWSFENMKVPDENFWAIDIPSLKNRNHVVQCKVIGVFKAENDYWSLISSFSHVDEHGEIHLDVISSVYAKKFGEKYLLVSSAEYLKSVLEYHKVGQINYYVHPYHKFQMKEAQEMNEFNLKMSDFFGVQPLSFDYFVAKNARDISNVWGYEYMNRMYNPSGKGGIASWRNMTIYSGNNSSNFPHELVHLYTYHIVPSDPHLWVGEGIATFLGGKSDFSFNYHLMRLREFLTANPEFDLTDISKLKMSIPNGEYISDFRYVIGGLFMKKIYEKEGLEGLMEALRYGTADSDFYRLIEDKLGVERAKFGEYIHKEMHSF